MSKLLSSIAVLCAAIGGVAAYSVYRAPVEVARFSSLAPNMRWGKGYLPNLPVIDQNGIEYRFYDDLIKGKKVIINFMFTTCTDICPLTTARMAQLADKLGDSVGRDVEMYSITIDPEHDSPTQLKRYADAFHIRPGWKFLTGKPADVQLIRDKLGERSRIKSEHRHEMLLGNDDAGDWSKDSAYGDLDRVVMNVQALDPHFRRGAQSVKTSEANYVAIGEKPGEALFTKACASCHSVGKGDRVGPDLMDVSGRRTSAWLTSFITRPDKVLASDDPIARTLLEKFPAVTMPNLGLSEVDANDVLAYIEAQSYGVHASVGQPFRVPAPHHHHEH